MGYTISIKDMYDRSKTWVKMVEGDSNFNVLMLLNQGSSISLILFSLVMDVVMWKIKGKAPWFMLFADDIVLDDETCRGVRTI